MKLFMDELWLSPYTFTVLCALREKKIDCEIKLVSFKKSVALDEEFRKKSFTQLIPTFEEDSLVLCESLAILEYLEERHPEPPIFPRDIASRARARMLMNWYRSAMTALRNERSTETVFYKERRATKPLSPEARDEVAELFAALQSFHQKGATTLFGAWCSADAETALMLHRLILNGDEVPEALKRYAEANWSRPSVAEFVNHPRRAFESYYS